MTEGGNPDDRMHALLNRIRRFVLGRPDLLDLLGRQSRLLPRSAFPHADTSGEQFLEIYLEEHRAFFNLVKDHLRRDVRVLEVGGGFGFFHVLARDTGAQIVSVEPSDAGFSLFREFAVELLTEFTGGADDFIDARVEEFDAPAGSFDLVVSNNVLEHVADVGTVMTAMHRLTTPGGLQIHHCPNYLFPYEPHYKVPVLPCAVRATGEIFWRRFRRDTLWQSLNSINSLRVSRLVRRLPGATVTFRNAFAFTLERLTADEHLPARHGWLTRLALLPALRPVLLGVPPALMSPMIFEVRKAA